ncbi:WD40 repeat 2 [Purpureocillium lavendulum]|uniref:WD40 repeat 2 n=1 Tax=Purpureocillium lavendulum TaxID=1247861 RepID=A0AB34FHY6_9HYPO|nr:WD40 repeat 2 [Purpureocillium lavendulum]
MASLRTLQADRFCLIELQERSHRDQYTSLGVAPITTPTLHQLSSHRHLHCARAFSTMASNWVIETPSTLAAKQHEQDPKWVYDLVEDDTKLTRPGFGLPLGWLPDGRFPVLVCPPMTAANRNWADSDSEWCANTLLIREACMLKLVDDLTDKPEWWRKIHDAHITAKWKAEALALDWTAYREHADFTPNMVDACFDEIRRKAALYEKTGLVPIFDYSVAAIKSDKLMSEDLRNALVAAVKPLEDVPEANKDWHPGSDGKVLDLVHPSLCPLVYGRTRVLPDRRVPLDDCLSYCGVGEVIPKPDPSEAGVYKCRWYRNDVNAYSTKFQWLPCDVSLDKPRGDGDEAGPTIDSYINNLHPVEHAALYPVIQRFIKAALPAWDLLYTWPDVHAFQRLTTNAAKQTCLTPEICERHDDCSASNRPVGPDEGSYDSEEEGSHHEEEGAYERSPRGLLDAKWFRETHPMDVPDAYVPPPPQKCEGATDKVQEKEDPENRVFPVTPHDVKTTGFFHGARRIQVIVKLASIHLTPEKPTYDGGAWHIEGQLNEHICATALFYYASDNITASRLSFRTPANAEDLSAELEYEQSDFWSIGRTFAMQGDSESTLQDVGSVATTQGRAVFFPNLLQHRVEPFALADPSRPGHRKILALFLVDPAVPVVSTANVPPQQRHWWPGEDHIRRGSRLPPELADMVLKNVDGFIGEDEARELRGELMAERTMMQEAVDGALNGVEFNFCEH